MLLKKKIKISKIDLMQSKTRKVISYLTDICHFEMARNLYPELITIEPFVTEA